MRKAIFRSLAGLCVVLVGLVGYGIIHPDGALSAFAPCTVASVACFYKVVDSGGVNVGAVNSSGQQAIQQLPTLLSTGTNWTSATPVNTTQTIFSGTNVKVVLVQVDVTSTVTGGAITFQVSYDGTNYIALSASQVLDPTSAVVAQVALPYTLAASTNKPFLLLMRGAQALQIKLSTAITGTATLTPYFTLLPDINFNEVNAIGANQSVNVNQFGGANTVTGTGVSGAGIPRVTVSNDSTVGLVAGGATIGAVNQAGAPWSNNVTQFGGNAIATGTGAGGSGIPRVTVSNDSRVGLVAGGAIIGKVQNLGNAGAILDFPGQNAAVPANALLTGCAFNTTPTTVTSGNATQVQCDSAGNELMKVNVALPTGANTIGAVTQGSPPWSNNTTQFGGTNLSTGTGAGGTGIPRVTVSNDSSLAANQSVNTNQFGGSAVATGTGAGGAGIPRVTVSNDSSLAANQSVNVNQIGGTTVVADPCQSVAKTYKPVNITANTQIITGASAKQTYICSVNIGPNTAATNVALVEGTGTTCATGTAGMAGGATAATGWNFAANGGIAYGDGFSAIASTATLADNVCLFVSGSTQVSGVLTWVQK